MRDQGVGIESQCCKCQPQPAVQQHLTQAGAAHNSIIISAFLSPNVFSCLLSASYDQLQGNNVKKINTLLPNLNVLNRRPINVYSSPKFLKFQSRHYVIQLSIGVGLHSSTNVY